jgi:protein-S-isoprenylcysteine O-methyltransferase Ste14
MFPVLVGMYVHLARQEERDTRATFGAAYDSYARDVPGWLLRLGRLATGQSNRAQQQR